jgi:hypothetical protein
MDGGFVLVGGSCKTYLLAYIVVDPEVLRRAILAAC